MKLFKIFNISPFKKNKLPSKEFLYKTFYNRKKYPYSGVSKKNPDPDYLILKDLELEFLENLIDNYPTANLTKVKSTKDFTLDCIIPEILYKIRCTVKGNYGDVGLVHIQNKSIDVYCSNTYLYERGIRYSKETKFDRIQLKKEILELFNK